MRVAILGGGLQGCCVALALAHRGVHCTIFDKNSDILTKAAAANEGKVHLGYMYAADPSLATAEMMVRGAFAFGPFFERHVGIDWRRFQLSESASYAVRRDGQYDVNQVSSYLARVHQLVVAHASGSGDYLRRPISRALRPWHRSELVEQFDDDIVRAVFDTPEIAVNPTALTSALRAAVVARPDIEIRYDTVVQRAARTDAGLQIQIAHGGQTTALDFDHVVNALWDGRIKLDLTMGIQPSRQWIHRLKYGVGFRLPEHIAMPISTTFITGPFGEVVAYDDRSVYLTWYPDCVREITTDISPPDWQTYPGDDLKQEIARATMASMGRFIGRLRDLGPDDIQDLTVRGGAIVAWGKSDIYDPGSELHSRFAIGITSRDGYHSIDPGKLTMAPYFAEQCADRISPP